MADYYREVIGLLRANGFEFKRQGRGDHEIWWNPRTRIHVTVDRKLKSKFTAKWNFEGSWPRQGLLGSAKCAGYRPCIAAEAAGEAVKLKGG
jgi:predicted RNA binding protein YcfA (HicA-like mRNA interferase family)